MLWERCGGSRSACRDGAAEMAMVIARGDAAKTTPVVDRLSTRIPL